MGEVTVINPTSCTGCWVKFNKDTPHFNVLDDLGTAKFCGVCKASLDKNRGLNWTNRAGFTPEQQKRLGEFGKPGTGYKEGAKAHGKAPAQIGKTGNKGTGGASPPPAGGGTQSSFPSRGATGGYGMGYTPPAKCRHFQGVPVGKGVVWVSSDYHPDSNWYSEADAAIFFASSWKTKGAPTKPIGEVWQEGTNGVALPVFEPPSDPMSGPVIYVNWTDHGAPPKGIVQYINWAASLLDEGKTVQIGCLGGHGRTGTFLAYLALKTGEAKTALQAHRFVWENVCFDSIEGNPQHDSIYNYAGQGKVPLTDRDTQLKGLEASMRSALKEQQKESEEETHTKPIGKAGQVEEGGTLA
jgi:hypothetical protein